MKKHFSSLKVKLSLLAGLFLMIGGSDSFASEIPEPIPLSVMIEDPIPIIPGLGKGPESAPTITQDGYEFSFQSSHPAYTLYIVEDDVVVYSVLVSLSTTSVILPSWLSGEYELQLHPDDCNYYFYGYIEL